MFKIQNLRQKTQVLFETFLVFKPNGALNDYTLFKNRIHGRFFEETLKGERYLDFLQFALIPALAVLFPNLS